MILPNCKDPSITMLKSKGYNIVQLPKADLRPTQLLVRNGKRLQRIGELASVFTADPGAPLPPITADQPSTSVAGQKSAAIDAQIGIRILGGLISALGGSQLGLTVGYQRARTIQFEFSDTLENNMQPALLDQFLAGAMISPFARAVKDMLESDDIYVITSTLKGSKINVVATDSNSNNLEIDVPVVQQAIGANVKLSSSGASAVTVSYEGKIPLVFGFQAIRLIFDDGRYRTMKPVDAGSVVLEAAAEQGDEYVYLTEDSAVATD